MSKVAGILMPLQPKPQVFRKKLFETNLRNERYLPFELSGAVSQWRLELPADVRQFDYNTISDAILHLRYTAQDGGGLLSAVEKHKTMIDVVHAAGSVRLFSVRHEFPTEWARFTSVKIDGTTTTAGLSLTFLPQHYPFWAQGIVGSGKAQVNTVKLFAKMLPTNKNLVSCQVSISSK